MSVSSGIKHVLKEVHSRPSPPSEVSEDKLFDELFGSSVEEYGEALEKITDVVNERTRDMREARDAAFKVASKLSKAFELCWRETWHAARTEMILEASDERT